MKKIIVKKTVLTDVIKKNMDTHLKEYEETKILYLQKLKVTLITMVDEIGRGKIPVTHIDIPQPTSHVGDYKTILDMLAMDISETIELDQDEYRNFVEDDWGWKHSFDMTNSFYSKRGR